MPKSLFILLLCSLLGGFAFGQTKDVSVPVFFEKAYLHTDRDVYAQTEDIWFKAYLVNAQTNEPINYSHILYVELISPQAKIISRQMLRLENGLGNGDFKLTDTIAPGNYRLRAYTNYMRNFGDNFIFEKEIAVIKMDETVPAAIAAVKSGKKTSIPVITQNSLIKDTLPTVSFFPEGGAMVNGISAFIAVKAEDLFGRGVKIKGTVIDNSGETIASFSCDSLGFGAFTLLPDSRQHYKAQLILNGQQRQFALPQAAANGFAIHSQLKQGHILTGISCDAQTFDRINGQTLIFTAGHSGKTYYRKVLQLAGAQQLVSISEDLLPEGVANITISDGQARPLFERLIYIHHFDEPELSITTDKPGYASKEKVTVQLKLDRPGKANLSLAAVDAATVPVPAENILSYLELSSEIRGTIEHPGRYFDTTNTNRFKQLDLLLLTQGWRGFVWKKLVDTPTNYARQPEQGLTITGRVTSTGEKDPLPGINVTMHAPKAEGQKLFYTLTDPAGRFVISDPLIYGYQLLAFTSRKSDKLDDIGRSKGKSGGWIHVDSLSRDALPVYKTIGEQQYLPQIQSDTPSIAKLKQSFHVPGKNNLKEVVIKANTSRLTTREPPQVHNIGLSEQKQYDDLGHYLSNMIPEAEVIVTANCAYCRPRPFLDGREMVISGKGVIPIMGIYADHSKIDYCRVCQEDYIGLPMADILKVTINRYKDVFGLGVSVSIIMRPGVLEAKDYFDNTTADIVGYYKARVFYKPKFGLIDDGYDPRRNTIHWEPYIVTDNKGEATLSFYNTAQPGKVRLVVQGITDKGEPLVSTIDYIIK